MVLGSCLCGAVRYEISGALGPIVFCHCRQCRKSQGGAFAVNAPVQASQFRLLAGEEVLTEYESSPGKKRVFCKVCGSPILSKRANAPDVLRLRVGGVDSAIPGRPSAHIFVASNAAWFEITDTLPQHAERP